MMYLFFLLNFSSFNPALQRYKEKREKNKCRRFLCLVFPDFSLQIITVLRMRYIFNEDF